MRGGSYSPQKHAKLKETQQKIAVKINNVPATIAGAVHPSKEYIVKKKSCITPSKVPYNYIFSDIFPQ